MPTGSVMVTVVPDTKPLPAMVTGVPPETDPNPGETEVTVGGAGAATVKVTGMLLGDPPAPDAVTVTAPLYVPAARPAMLTPTVTVDGAVPLPGDAVSQEALVPAVHVSAPPPAFVTDNDWLAGLPPPTCAV